MLIEGRNAVTEALKGDVTLEKVLLLKDAPNINVKPVVTLCRERKIPVQFVDRYALDRLSVTGDHRGFIGIATEFKYSDVEEIITKKDGEELLILLLDGIEDPHNLGAIVRVADCAGASGIIIPRHRCCGVTDTVVKVSSGAASHVKIAKVANINDVIRRIKEQNVMVFASDMAGDSVYRTDLKGDIALVIGGEGSGVHTLTKKLCDGVIGLPQMGKVNSLNASVATGILLYECVRQRGNYVGR